MAVDPVTAPLPEEFDYQRYVGCPENVDLAGFCEADAQRHYESFGKQEGRVCSAVDSRTAFLGLVPQCGALLEIGPFFAPGFSKDGRDVQYIDALSSAELERRASDLPAARDKAIPHIDYVWRGEPYRELIGRCFANAFSSHTIEHQPCLVRHLADVSSVLEARGRYFLAIPDRRYCFDHFLPESTLADVVEAHAQQRTQHVIRNVIEHHFLITHNDPRRHWAGDSGEDPSRAPLDRGKAASLLDEVRQLQGEGTYVDVHAWKFTPDSFRAIMRQLQQLGLTDFETERVYPTLRGENEFYAVLRKGQAVPG